MAAPLLIGLLNAIIDDLVRRMALASSMTTLIITMRIHVPHITPYLLMNMRTGLSSGKDLTLEAWGLPCGPGYAAGTGGMGSFA